MPVTKACIGAEPSETFVPTNNDIITARQTGSRHSEGKRKTGHHPGLTKSCSVPDAMPSRFLGAAFIAALVLGG